MSTDADNDTGCPNVCVNQVNTESGRYLAGDTKNEKIKKPVRKVCFPEDDQLVTQYFEPANPWQDVPPTSRAQLAAEYLEACRKHNTPPIDSVLHQIRELPEGCIGGASRCTRLSVARCCVRAPAADALEAVLRRVRARRLELHDAQVDDDAAEALFDMIEYYESAVTLSIHGQREFGIRGWQAASRLIKKSAALAELELCGGALEAGHAPVLARALRPAGCRLRALHLQRAALAGEPLLSLVIALKSNRSVRELRLGDNKLSPADAAQLAALLRVNTVLQLLDLSNNQIQDSGVGQLADAVSEQAGRSPHSPPSPLSPAASPDQIDHNFLSGCEGRGLAYLVLWNNQLTRNCAQYLSKLLRTSTSLRVLNVGRNALGGDALRALAQAAPRALHSLGLQAARLGPDAARALHDLVRGGHLQRVDLRDNRLGVAGLQAILTALTDNTVLTQVDLDDPSESCEEGRAASRLVAEIRGACARNEPGPRRAPHRRISLTCHTAHVPRPLGVNEEERRGVGLGGCGGRLRSPAPSPAPSPAGSPVPHTRFSVVPVTPDSSPSTPPTPTRPSGPSRFRVVQVHEPPQIQIHAAESPRRNASRFSVTRNYDAAYDPTPTPSPPPTPVPPVPIDHQVPTPHPVPTELPAPVDQTRIIKTDNDVIDSESDCEDVKLIAIECEDGIKVNDESDISTGVIEDLVKEVTVETEEPAKVHSDQNDCKYRVSVDKIDPGRDIPTGTEELGNHVKEMQDLTKNNDCTQNNVINVNRIDNYNVPVKFIRGNVALKKNKSESSLDSPDLEVSRLMNKKQVGPFCDSNSSLEVSGSSVESLNALDQQATNKPIIIQESVESDTELDRRKADHIIFSTESSIESTSDVIPVNSNFLNMSVSSNESVSPIIFGVKKIHGSLSSLEASVSSLDSTRQERVMVTSADSGIEYSLQHHSESNSSNEGTLTNKSIIKDTKKETQVQETLTSPKRTSSLLDVPALKNKGLERIRKISWVAPSSSFHIPKPDPEPVKLPSNLEKLLSLFHHPSSIFSRSTAQNEEERKSASNTPPRKDSSLTSAFWSWGSTTEKEKEEKVEDKESSSEATDSTLSERVQVSFIDESFSKKLDSKTPSTDTDNTLSEFQSFPTPIDPCDESKVTEPSTDDNKVQNLDVSECADAASNGNRGRAAHTDLYEPNDSNTNVYDDNKNTELEITKLDKLDEKLLEIVRPRSFAAVLKSSGSENSLDKPTSPEIGASVDKLPNKVIRGIKENISPENTLTTAMVLYELNDRLKATVLKENEPKEEIKMPDLAPIATIEEVCDEAIDDQKIEYIDHAKDTYREREVSIRETKDSDIEMENVDFGKDALCYMYDKDKHKLPLEESLAKELKDAEIKAKMIDLSPELVVDEGSVSEVFLPKDVKGLNTPIPERAKIKKANSLEDISQTSQIEKKEQKKIAFNVHEKSSIPCDIPERRSRLRTRSGSSPKSLPESLNKPCPLKDPIFKKKKKVSSLGKIARDSLLALNMSEDEIAEFRRSYKLTSVESLRSLESVSEDANSQSGNSMDSRCRSCLRTSQESLMSLDSITEDCRCTDECGSGGT